MNRYRNHDAGDITMLTRLTVIASLLVLSSVAVAEPPNEPTGDALDEALALVNMHRDDLGWRPKGYWTGFPADIPYKLRQFDDLLAEPMATITYLRTMGNTARETLSPVALDAEPDRASSGALYRIVQRLGVVRKTGVLRSYSCNLTAAETPLYDAVIEIYERAKRPTKFITFGTESPYPLVEKDLAAAVETVPVEIQPIIGKLIMNVLDAHHWATLAWRNVPLEDRFAVSNRLDIGREQVDALDYCPAFDDVAGAWDEPSLFYAGLKCVEALDQARLELKAVAADAGAFEFRWATPLGVIHVCGTGEDVTSGDDALLIVDLGGNDIYFGSVAASSPTRPIGLLLDIAGDDEYSGDRLAQGAGVCGIGVLLDVDGEDSYHAAQYAQGAGQFGLGACIDLAGNDTYFTQYSGQGCGYFGVGIQVDAAGDDIYKLYADGQGFGGSAGVGTLVDYSGNDQYEAVRDQAVTGRPSYHSELKISVSNAQGCAMGRRGDGADGHSWAGGMGSLIDIHGDDEYLSGNWSMGCGYWFGMGFLYDGEGNDRYNGVSWSQASGAHFCIGVLLDDGGDDHHVVEESSNQSLAFGHDFTVAMLVNLGGDDIYEIERDGLAFSINRSVAMLIDIEGNDHYRQNPKNRPGLARYDASRFANWDSYSTYFADSSSIGIFLDVGGDDTYGPCYPAPERHKLLTLGDRDEPESGVTQDSQPTAGTVLECDNNMTWLDPPDSPNPEARNFSVGVDRESGVIDLLPKPEKRPGG